MLIVADTSPLNYLILIESVHVLPSLYGRILIPPEVLGELRDAAGPQAVQGWAAPWRCISPRLEQKCS